MALKKCSEEAIRIRSKMQRAATLTCREIIKTCYKRITMKIKMRKRCVLEDLSKTEMRMSEKTEKVKEGAEEAEEKDVTEEEKG